MDIARRVENLEKLVNSLISISNNNYYYTNAGIDGVRQDLLTVNNKVNEAVMPQWNKNGYPYFAGERVTYDGSYYRCIQNHTSQADWTPDTAVSLWVSISDPSEEFPEWKQPAGAHDAYNKGDKVSHNEKHWISDIDANVYEPGVYGWSEVE